MLKRMRGFVCVLLVLVLASVASAQLLTVSSPTNNAYLGLNNTLSFQISGATFQTTVSAQINGPSGSSTSQNNFTPSSTGTISGTLPINFSASATGGAYTIVVTATSPGALFNTVTVPVTVVTVGPKFLEFTPISGVFVTGTVPIRATINDTNFDNWTVTVDNGNIPNNTGTTTNVFVNWDTTAETNGTQHTITITANDLAGNTATQSMTVTVDNTKPTITLTYPQSTVTVDPGKSVAVIIDISDVAASALTANSVSALVQTTTGVYLATVSRVSTSNLNSTTMRWTGRIQTAYVHLPQKFNIVVTATDLAGNVATPATITVTLR